MLVLSRKVSELIILERGSERIEIMPVRIGDHATRIGITADKSWNIRRGELTRNNAEAQAEAIATAAALADGVAEIDAEVA